MENKQILVLGGGSPRNADWVDSCGGYFESEYNQVFSIHYDHWTRGEKVIDFALEMEKIKSVVGNQENLHIFAKSIGTILALKCIQAGIIGPKKCVFFGMPLKIYSELYDDWSILSELDTPALVFHNDNDSTADYNFTKNKVTELSPQLEFKTLSGDNHDYLDFEQYQEEIRQFTN